nr:MAG TPA: hypothetical protein [Caudoviricetes sp.]
MPMSVRLFQEHEAADLNQMWHETDLRSLSFRQHL